MATKPNNAKIVTSSGRRPAKLACTNRPSKLSKHSVTPRARRPLLVLVLATTWCRFAYCKLRKSAKSSRLAAKRTSPRYQH